MDDTIFSCKVFHLRGEVDLETYLCMFCYQPLIDIPHYKSTCIHQEYCYKSLDSHGLCCIRQCLNCIKRMNNKITVQKNGRMF